MQKKNELDYLGQNISYSIVPTSPNPLELVTIESNIEILVKMLVLEFWLLLIFIGSLNYFHYMFMVVHIWI